MITEILWLAVFLISINMITEIFEMQKEKLKSLNEH